MGMTLEELAGRIGAKVVGDGSIRIEGCAGIDCAHKNELTFVANSKYSRFLKTTQAAAVVVNGNVSCPDHLNLLVSDDPYFAFRNAMIELHGFRKHPDAIEKLAGENAAISHRACVHATSNIGEGSIVHPNAVVEEGASVGKGCVLYPGAYVGKDATLGDETILFPNAVVYDRCVVGSRVTLHSNTVVGHDGFGYATHKGVHHKIPQAGIVVIEDDVEIGAGCAIERAAVGETRIGRGTKFADLISIGHGTKIGAHCLLVSLVGVSGSVEMGDYVVLGGQAGVVGHLRIGDRVQAAARTAIAQDVPDGMKVAGVPAVPLEQAKRNVLAGTELYELVKRVRKLEREMRSKNEK